LKAKRWLVRLAILALALGLCAALAGFVYNVPFVHDRLEWRVVNFRAQVWYALFPPEDVVFTPDPTIAAMVRETLAALTPTDTPTPALGPTARPTLTPTATLEPTPIPTSVMLTGIRHEYQHWNNCGPATLSMALSYWGWQGDQRDTAAALKPNPRDKNVMPYEMEAFVEEHTGLQAVVRVGGDLDTLRRFIAAGFPVLIEKGFDVHGLGWMGHYQLLAGYDDANQRFSAYDSYEGDFSEGRTLPVPYSRIETYWRHFNYVYLVIYPSDRESEVMALLGPQADETANWESAALRASEEIAALTGRELYFAWFNRGNSLVHLQDYAGAAAAFDEAFQIYPQIPEDERPWRMLWYQTGPYFAYYYSGRYNDVINLATLTLSQMDEPILEESYYWRALAREALGDVPGAIEDLRASLQYHPGFGPSLTVLDRLGAAP
jgi:tetratricopeptide (TPR) repeat protein